MSHDDTGSNSRHPEHYFADTPQVSSAPESLEITLPDLSFTMRTDAGVFSHGRLDAGTSLLLRSVPLPPQGGDLLDLGCGAGAIALTLAQRALTANVWAVDVNERARALCRSNADALELGNIVVRAPGEVPEGVQFETIWSNPPIRIGKSALHELLLTWLGRLADDGDAWLVVHRHLGADSLQRWLDTVGWSTERFASRRGYRVLRAHRGDATTDSA